MSDKCKEAFINAGYWPNETMWQAWEAAWHQGAAEEREACKAACIAVREQDMHAIASFEYKVGRNTGVEFCFNEIDRRGYK